MLNGMISRVTAENFQMQWVASMETRTRYSDLKCNHNDSSTAVIIIVDDDKNIVFLRTEFWGSMNDAAGTNFNLMDRIGPRTDNDMTVDVSLLADKGYPDTPPLINPFRTTQILPMMRAYCSETR